MKIPLYQVDAFTSKIFSGNPAAVCPLEKWINDDVMQNIAQENNLSETAFFVKSKNQFDIRWFTPVAELDLAGHPTLATAHVILKEMKVNIKKMEAECKLGQITATDLADYLVEKSIPFRKAHEIAGKIVAHAESNGMQIFELEISELRKFSKLISEDVSSHLDPLKSINSRKLVGGTAPSQIRKEINFAKKVLAKR